MLYAVYHSYKIPCCEHISFRIGYPVPLGKSVRNYEISKISRKAVFQFWMIVFFIGFCCSILWEGRKRGFCICWSGIWAIFLFTSNLRRLTRRDRSWMYANVISNSICSAYKDCISSTFSGFHTTACTKQVAVSAYQDGCSHLETRSWVYIPQLAVPSKLLVVLLHFPWIWKIWHCRISLSWNSTIWKLFSDTNCHSQLVISLVLTIYRYTRRWVSGHVR